jgi:glycosyltransferase involved in cell wall biosynthesis
MRVGFDLRKMHSGNLVRGVGFYTRNLTESLKKYTEVEVEVFNTDSEVKKVDLIHYPFFDFFQPTLPLRKSLPTVVTVHDITPLLFPTHYPPGIKGKLKHQLQKLALKSVNAIITDSNSAKSDISKHFKIPESKIFVTYLAAAEHFKVIKDQKVLEQVKKKFELPEKFALFVGSVGWNKNLLGIAEGSIKAGVEVVFVGKDFTDKSSLDHAERKSFAQFLAKYENNPLVHILGFVDDEEMVALFNLSFVTMLPSFYEGFGMTILESQACGIPVITSNLSSMPEVGGDSVIYVDPENPDSIAEAIKSLDDKKTYDPLVKKGLENVKRFSWEKTAKETESVYQKVIQ